MWVLLSKGGYSWSSFFSSIKSDLSELKTSVSEGANDLYTYVKDSVPEGIPIVLGLLYLESHSQTNEQDNNIVSLSSRLGGFLSNTINKTKSILSEVFDENQEEDKEWFSFMMCSLEKLIRTKCSE